MNKIVDFPVRISAAQRLQNKALQRLYVTWRQLVRSRNTATLQELSSARLRRLLSWAGLVETAANEKGPGQWRFAGTALCRLAGKELRGQEPFDAAPHFERQVLRRLLADVMRLGQPALARLKVPLKDAEDALHLELLALPVRDATNCPLVMLVMQPQGSDAALPEDLPWQAEGQLSRMRLTGLWMLRDATPAPATRKVAVDNSANVVPLPCRKGA